MPTSEYKYADEQGLSALSEEIFQKVKYHVDRDEHTVTAGNPITFETESAQMAKNVKVGFEPIQDLHGYDHPWPAGGGKNKLVSGEKATKSSDGVTIVCDGNGSYTITRTATGSDAVIITFDCDSYTIPSFENATIYFFNTVANGNVTFEFWNGSTRVEQWALATQNRVSSYNAMKGAQCNKYGITVPANFTGTMTLRPMICDNANETVFAPYSNICPIGGLDSVSVKATGFNQWDEEWELGKYDSNNGQKTDSDLNIRSKNLIKIFPNTHYCAIGQLGGHKCFFDADKNFISYLYTSQSNNMRLFTSPSNAYYMSTWSQNNMTSYEGSTCINISDANKNGTYEPYTESNVDLNLPATIYSGELDLESGVLAADMASVDLGTFDWDKTVESGGAFFTTTTAANNAVGNSPQPFNGMCDRYVPHGSDGMIFESNVIAIGGVSKKIFVSDRMLDNKSTSEFKTAMSGVQLCYELATPITYQLTPQQLALFRGTNVVSTNASKVRVTYRDGRLALMEDMPRTLEIEEAKTDAKLKQVLGNFAPVEETNVASTNYAIGSPVVVGTVLRKITSAVAANETIDSTNSAAITIAELFSLIVDANSISY